VKYLMTMAVAVMPVISNCAVLSGIPQCRRWSAWIEEGLLSAKYNQFGRPITRSIFVIPTNTVNVGQADGLLQVD